LTKIRDERGKDVRRVNAKEVITFLTTLTACGAFLVGAVRIWGVPSDKLVSGLIMVLMMLGGLALLAFLLVLAIKLIGRGRDE